MTDGDLLSTGLVARRLGCSLSFLKDAERAGKLPATRRLIGVGREWRAWPVTDLPMIQERVGELVRESRRRDRAA